MLKAGIVAFNDRHSTLSCAVRDLSDTGALLRMNGSVPVPDAFELIIELDGLEALCDVVWRKGHDLGVRFVGATRKVAARRSQTITPIVPDGLPSLRRKLK